MHAQSHVEILPVGLFFFLILGINRGNPHRESLTKFHLATPALKLVGQCKPSTAF